MKAQREALGWTQGVLATVIKCGKRAIQKIERSGRARPETITLINDAMREEFSRDPQLKANRKGYTDIRISMAESNATPRSTTGSGFLSEPNPASTAGTMILHNQVTPIGRRASLSQPESISPPRPNESKKIQVLSSQSVSLMTRMSTPQWTEYREVDLNGGRLSQVSCRFTTSSPYFRLGFKLFTSGGRIFGDGSIQSQDRNLIVHVGRNKRSRTLFFTSYRDGIREGPDRNVCNVAKQCSKALEVSINGLWVLTFSVEGKVCYEGPIPPESCERLVILAWGDHDEYMIDVADLSATAKRC